MEITIENNTYIINEDRLRNHVKANLSELLESGAIKTKRDTGFVIGGIYNRGRGTATQVLIEIWGRDNKRRYVWGGRNGNYGLTYSDDPITEDEMVEEIRSELNFIGTLPPAAKKQIS